jgi:hypothetical protein
MKGRPKMALVQVRKSDKSGSEIPESTGARIRVIFNDGSKTDLRADLTDEEVKKILPFAKPVEERPARRKRNLTL